MAKPQGRSKREVKRKRAEWEGYIDHTVTSDTKEQYIDWVATEPDLPTLLREVCDTGYRASVSYDDYSKSYTGTLYAQFADMDNAGWNLSSRSSNPIESLYRVVFLHNVVLGGEWLDDSIDSQGDGW